MIDNQAADIGKSKAMENNALFLSEEGVGYKILLPHKDRDYIQRNIASELKPYEHGMLRDMRSRLGRGDHVIDVGANIGNHSLYLAVVAGCHIDAFEPDPVLSSAIGASARLNSIDDRISVHQLGIGSVRGFGHLVDRDETNIGAQRIEPSPQGDDTIQIIRLDDMQWEHRISAIKIDVEGMEHSVLLGASGLIDRDQPLIYVECRTREDFETIHDWMEEHGYRYWDTFNATPTHLYIHKSRISTEKYADRLLLSLIDDKYRFSGEISNLRDRLYESAGKYRSSNEAISALKLNLEAANKKYRFASDQIRAMKKMIQPEGKISAELHDRTRPDSLLEEIMKMETGIHEYVEELKESKREYQYSLSERHELEIRLDTLRSELESSESRVNRQNQQLMDFHDRLLKEEIHFKAKTEAMEISLAAAQEEISTLENRLADVALNLKAVQGNFLESEKARKEIAEELVNVRNEFDNFIAASRETRENDDISTRLLQSNRKYRQANETIASIKEKLDRANHKYRQLTGVEIPALKQKIESISSVRDMLTRKIGELESEQRMLKERLISSENSISRIRTSLTYKLGNVIRNSFTSWRGLLASPANLIGLYFEAKTRAGSSAIERGELGQENPSDQAGEIGGKPLSLLPDSEHAFLLMKKSSVPDGRLRMAAIMDDFTFSSYSPECELHQLTPAGWRSELETCRPEILFVESAWRGKDDLWGSRVCHNSRELQDIISWCRTRGIPTVFWNKEDPVHYETFLNTAKQFDYVFTTDIDCISRYKADLNSDNIYLLPFACQPEIHNPIEVYARKDAFCFAGAYYVRYPERTRDLEEFIAELPRYRPVEIYDRNFGKNDPNYQFPETYQKYIVGTLPFSEIDKAYKGYRYAINLNSIKQSQTMFARRIYELLACNTITVSNYSRGVRQMLGDLVLTTDNGKEMLRRLGHLCGNERAFDKHRLAALRKVMLEHTYGNRLDYVLSKVLNRKTTNKLPVFTIVSPISTIDDVERIMGHYRRQTGVVATLTLVTINGFDGTLVTEKYPEMSASVRIMGLDEISGKKLGEIVPDSEWITAMLGEDYYGPNYLMDIALATRYSSAKAIGKRARHIFIDGEVILTDKDSTYKPVDRLMARCSAISRDAAEIIPMKDWIDMIGDFQYIGDEQLSIDPFNYCAYANAKGHERMVSVIVDDSYIYSGIDTETITACAEKIEALTDHAPDCVILDSAQLSQIFGRTISKNIKTHLGDSGWLISSNLADGKHEYIYAPNPFIRDDPAFGRVVDNRINLHLQVSPGLHISLVMLFLDKKMRRIGHAIRSANCNHTVEMESGTEYITIGFRILSSGETEVKRLLMGHRNIDSTVMPSRSKTLIVTNHYPSYEDLYRNAFVHTRARAYQDNGISIDVFRLGGDESTSWHEYQDVDVTTGSRNLLKRYVSGEGYKSILVHFLSSDMWDSLKATPKSVPIIVWIHGSEIHPWNRRKYNFTSEEQISKAKIESNRRLNFWRELFTGNQHNLHFVFVSESFSREVMEDIGFKIPREKYSIIHNPIDTDMFTYVPKPAEQRKRILSIRPYASRQYANDLAVSAIVSLSKRPFFDQLYFHIIGNGSLFESTVAPLMNYQNVKVEKRFLSRQEIAELHREYGIFLCPSRWDSQGVSRDEAMASGLVPITNCVAAIPEFMDETCGIIAPDEDYEGLARGIEKIYCDSQFFSMLSENAARRVREQSAMSNMINNEISLFIKNEEKGRCLQ